MVTFFFFRNSGGRALSHCIGPDAVEREETLRYDFLCNNLGTVSSCVYRNSQSEATVRMFRVPMFSQAASDRSGLDLPKLQKFGENPSSDMVPFVLLEVSAPLLLVP